MRFWMASAACAAVVGWALPVRAEPKLDVTLQPDAGFVVRPGGWNDVRLGLVLTGGWRFGIITVGGRMRGGITGFWNDELGGALGGGLSLALRKGPLSVDLSAGMDVLALGGVELVPAASARGVWWAWKGVGVGAGGEGLWTSPDGAVWTASAGPVWRF